MNKEAAIKHAKALSIILYYLSAGRMLGIKAETNSIGAGTQSFVGDYLQCLNAAVQVPALSERYH